MQIKRQCNKIFFKKKLPHFTNPNPNPSHSFGVIRYRRDICCVHGMRDGRFVHIQVVQLSQRQSVQDPHIHALWRICCNGELVLS